MSFFDPDTQNLNVRSIPETVLEKSKKNFLKPGAFSENGFAKIDWPVTFFPI